MDNALRHTLADRAFLFDDPDAYLAGVDAALRAMAQLDSDRADAEDPPVAAPRAGG